MSTPLSVSRAAAPAEALSEHNRETGLPLNPWLMLAVLAATHFLVDIMAATTNPLWPSLERHLGIATGGLLWVYVCWSISTSFGQLAFGLWADRFHSHWLLWGGPAVAIVCICSIGIAQSALQLAAIVMVGGLGIAAFHPEAAATAGALNPSYRSRFMAIFALCGYFGQSIGPYYSGAINEALGPSGLSWGMVWGLPVLMLLALGLRQAPLVAPSSATKTAAADMGPVPYPLVGLLLTVGSLRILPALGVPLSLAYLLEARDESSAVIGAVQSAFMAGITLGAVVCASWVQRSWERRLLWVCPLLASPLLLTLGVVSGWGLVSMVAVCGVLLGITMPVYISYGQQLLPGRQRVASSITMGISWGLGSSLVSLVMWILTTRGSLPSIFYFFAGASLVSSLLSHLLPHSPHEASA